MRNPTVLSLTAACIASALLAVVLWAAPMTAVSLAVISLAFGVTAMVVAMRDRRIRIFEDPYDLRVLREIVAMDENPIPEDEPAETAYNTAMCRQCGEFFRAELAVCPRCGRSQYG
jgi:hypothetical protein